MAQHEVDPLREFDALLQQDLSVTPSPEFLPRVRERIRLEPARSRWSLFAVRPSLVAVAAAAIIVLAVGVTIWIRSDAPPDPAPGIASTNPQPKPNPKVPSTAHPSTDVARGHPTPRTGLRPSATGHRPPATGHRIADTGHPTPDVLVDQRQRAALVSMLRLINDGQLTEDSFKNTTPSPAQIDVQPVTVSPIVVSGVLPSESGRK
jgi:hypothetical protein